MQHAPILKGLSALAEERGWVVEVLPLVAGQRFAQGQGKGVAARLESLKTFRLE
jgi:hypothetical protein